MPLILWCLTMSMHFVARIGTRGAPLVEAGCSSRPAPIDIPINQRPPADCLTFHFGVCEDGSSAELASGLMLLLRSDLSVVMLFRQVLIMMLVSN